VNLLIELLNILDFRTKAGVYPIEKDESIKIRIIKFIKIYFIICCILPIIIIAGLYINSPVDITILLTEIFRAVGHKGIVILYLLLFFLVEALFNIRVLGFLVSIPMYISKPRLLRKERRKERLLDLKNDFYYFLYGIIRVGIKIVLLILLLNVWK
jgi:hypothetical protein